jgi:anti-sigma B factor antagonist
MFEGRALALDGVTECRMAGELDAAAAADARGLLAGIEPTGAVLFDLDRVCFVDSAGLGVLVTGVRNLRERGSDVVLSVARPNVRRLLLLVGLDRVVPVVPSRAEARALAGAAPGVVARRAHPASASAARVPGRSRRTTA